MIFRQHHVERDVPGVDLGIHPRQHSAGGCREEPARDVQERILRVERGHEFLEVFARRGACDGERALSASRFDHRAIRGMRGLGGERAREQRGEYEAAEQRGATSHAWLLPG
jgi:hypothetical protein